MIPLKTHSQVQMKRRPALKKGTTKKGDLASSSSTTDETAKLLGQLSKNGRLTVGLDLGDRKTDFCILNERAEVVIQGKLATSAAELDRMFGGQEPMVIALEVGTHSPWISRRLERMGHDVVVANPRNVAYINKSKKKDDRADAEKLARLVRSDRNLLSPVRHRGEKRQRDLVIIKSRAALVSARTKLINAARGLMKSLGERLEMCDSEKVGVKLAEKLAEPARVVVTPLLESIEGLSKQIGQYDEMLKETAGQYPELELFKGIYGVGPVVELTYVLTIEDPARFTHSRDVGAFLGMVPGKRESGDRSPEMGISKEGDRLLRSLMVQSAQCILRKGAPDSDLRRWGLKQLGEDPKGGEAGKKVGKGRKKRVIVAVARRLAVMMHHIWANGVEYDPLYNAKAEAAAKERARKRVEAKAARQQKPAA